jgi:DNA-binding beta-propeller fold protein YncE
MRKRFIIQSAIGAVALLAWSLLVTVPASQATGNTVKFIATDEPGPWFKCDVRNEGYGCVDAGSKSLAIIKPGDTVQIDMGRGTSNTKVNSTNTVHTFTSLLWPVKSDGSNANNMPFDQPEGAFRGTRSVRLTTPGLYVFVCKLHPFMLAATIVDANGLGDGKLDLRNPIRLISYPTLAFNTNTDLAFRLLRAFFLITNTDNYQNHDRDTNPTGTWKVTLPDVPVLLTGVPDPVSLSALSIYTTLVEKFPPATIKGIGEVWIDAEYEKTSGKTKPGTAIAVNASTWKVTKRVALPDINMNNPHNMWTNRDQTVIYQTKWFGNELTAFNRITGRMIRNITVGDAPAHVMTRVDTDQVHVSLNGDNAVIELNPGRLEFSRRIFTQYPGQDPAQPHAHTMSFDGKTMVTPNSNTGDSTRIDLKSGRIKAKTPTGTLPIATGMMPDASKYYVSNYLDSTITCISIGAPACNTPGGKVHKKDIPLLLAGVAEPFANYNPFATPLTGDTTGDISKSGALPIQTPVSPDGQWVVTANTLSGTISFISTVTDTLEKVIPCSAGCHGVNFGAKKGGGYLAYVSSKFSNDLIVVDLATQAEVGRVVLVADGATKSDDSVSDLAGMGGQGVLPIPLVYNGWVQNLPRAWKFQLTDAQRHPFPQTEHEHEHD